MSFPGTNYLLDSKVLLYSWSLLPVRRTYSSVIRETSFLPISKLILTFEGELRYLETAFTLITLSPELLLVAQFFAGVARKEMWAGSRETSPCNPRAALRWVQSLLVGAQGLGENRLEHASKI